MTDRTDHPTDEGDDRLARVLADEAGAHRPVPDWDDVVDRAARARSGRRWIPTAAAVAVLALAVAVAATLTGGNDDAGVVADDPGVTAVDDRSPGSTTTSTEPSDPPPTTSVAGAVSDGPTVGPLDLPAAATPLADDEIVATIIDPESEFGSIAVVVLSTETGEVVRTVADGYDSVEGGVYGLTMSPDRRTVFFVLATTACTDEVHAVAADGSAGPVLVVPAASRVAVSSDGRWLAADIGGPCDESLDVDLVPLDGGTVRRFSVAGRRAVDSLAFTGDRTIMISDDVSFTAADGGGDPLLRSVDFDAATVEIVSAPVDGASYSGLSNSADGRFTALEHCCGGTGHDSTELVTFAGTEVVDRRALDIAGDVRFVRAVGVTGSGQVVVVGGDGQLRIDDRVLREHVGGIALG